MIHEEIEHHIVPRRYVGASNRLPRFCSSRSVSLSLRSVAERWQAALRYVGSTRYPPSLVCHTTVI
jgi:hypothetical protein